MVIYRLNEVIAEYKQAEYLDGYVGLLNVAQQGYCNALVNNQQVTLSCCGLLLKGG